MKFSNSNSVIKLKHIDSWCYEPDPKITKDIFQVLMFQFYKLQINYFQVYQVINRDFQLFKSMHYLIVSMFNW